MTQRYDVIVVGGGHNGLVSAALLAKAGRSVLVLERASAVGGAVRTEYPFPKAPGVGTSSGAYLFGLMPPELLTELEIEIPTIRRDPHYFLPTPGERYLLLGADKARNRSTFLEFFSEADWIANERLDQELSAIRDDIAPTWLQEPLSIAETAERFVRPELREAFLGLCHGSIGEYLDRFGFKSDLIKAMYAVTDGFSGLWATYDTPGTGMNFLIHNMCRLPGGDGTWMVVKGGMGTVSERIAGACRRWGADIVTSAPVAEIECAGGQAKGVVTTDGARYVADTVVVGADPFTMRAMVGADRLGDGWNTMLDERERPGTTLKLNMALSGLPEFTCMKGRGDLGHFNGTMHLLPDEEHVLQSLIDGFNAVKAGQLAEFPSIEWYIHTTVDPTLMDDQGRHNSALFVQWAPYDLAESDWSTERDRYTKHLLEILDRFAPGTSDLVVDTFLLTPRDIESHFGIHRGHIHHVDNSFGFSDRVPYRTPIDGLYMASAGCHPAGAVIGCAGHNAAKAVLRDQG